MWKTLTSTSYCQLCFHTQTKTYISAKQPLRARLLLMHFYFEVHTRFFRSPGVFAGGSVARTVRRVERVSAGCMSWLTSCWCEWAENTHTYTHTLGLTTARQARRSRETEEQFSFISSSRFLPPFHLYDFVKTKGKHTLARKKIERKLYKKLSAYVVILIMGRGKFRDRCTTLVTV